MFQFHAFKLLVVPNTAERIILNRLNLVYLIDFRVILRCNWILSRYLYSDCSADITSGNVVNMYRVADKYDILPLRLVCAGKVGECASMDNIGDLLVMVRCRRL